MEIIKFPKRKETPPENMDLAEELFKTVDKYIIFESDNERTPPLVEVMTALDYVKNTLTIINLTHD